MRWDLPHIASRIFGTPLAVARPKAEAILRAIGPRLGLPASALPVTADAGFEPRSRANVKVRDGIATVHVLGTLVRRAGALEAESGMSSYGEIGRELDAALADARVEGILLEIDSPGGEVAGLFELVEKIAAASKPVYAVANHDAYSAAYAIACAADLVYVAPVTGGVGSVGVVALHVDQSKLDEKAGLAFDYVFAGAKKVDGNPHEPLSDRARTDLQGEVDRLYGVFVTTVAENRGMKPEAVRATEAGVYMGDAAVASGLADRVGGLEDAARDLRREIENMDAKKATRELLGLSVDASDEAVLEATKGVCGKLEAAAKRGAELGARVAELEKLQAEANEREKASRREHALARVKTAKHKGLEANLDATITDEEQEEIVANLTSEDPRLVKAGEREIVRFEALAEQAKKVQGAKPRENPHASATKKKEELEAHRLRKESLERQGWRIETDKEGFITAEYPPGATKPYVLPT